MSEPLLDYRSVSVQLGGRPVLRGIRLAVERGETVVLLGRSGCGKTTLLRTANGLTPAAAGAVWFDGQPITGLDPIRLRRRIGYAIQDAGLFPHRTVAENAGLVPTLEGWPPGRIRERVDLLLEAVGLPPAVYGGRYPRQLSGGERQRAGLARALAADPPLLLLDEPFAALDPLTRVDLQRQFLELRARFGTTSVFVTHDLREAMRMATRIVLLKDGAIDTVATPEEFRRADSAEARAFLATLDDGAGGAP